MKVYLASLNQDGKIVLTTSNEVVEVAHKPELERNVWELSPGREVAVLARSAIHAQRLAAPHLGRKKA